MKYTCIYLVFICLLNALLSCKKQEDKTYEQSLANCFKKKQQSFKDANADLKFELENLECMKGSIGPDFFARTMSGDSISTKPVTGKAMVLYFWYVTPDAPLEFQKSDTEDFAAMNRLYHAFSDKVDFIGVPFNELATTKRYLQEHPLDFPQLDDKIIDQKHLYLTQNSHPFVLFINTKGRIVKIFTGSLRKRNLIIKKYTPVIQACITDIAYTE